MKMKLVDGMKENFVRSILTKAIVCYAHMANIHHKTDTNCAKALSGTFKTLSGTYLSVLRGKSS